MPLTALKNRLKRLLLRGRILKWWLRRITSVLASEYFSFLASHLNRSPAPCKLPTPYPPDVHRLLFICANMWESRELAPELQRLGDLCFLDVLPALPETDDGEVFDESRFEGLWKKQVSGRFDTAIVYLDASRLNQQILDRVRSVTDGPVFGLNLDDKTTYARYSVFDASKQGYRDWAGAFDCNLTNSRVHVEIYQDDGFPCLYLPTGYHYDPEIHRFNPASVFQYPISFVGSCKPEREWFVDHLRSAGIPVAVFGGGWKGGRFTSKGHEIYRNTQINLGIGYNLPGTQFTNLKNRDFECPGSGGCYLTTYDWELAEFFEIGRDILCYRSLDDFLEVYLFYSRRPEACREIARRGFERCRHEHTWAHRFVSAFQKFDLKATVRT